ncbi:MULTISPECIES: PspC domain-containing protein [Clostridium]|uniref:PspC domain-containing protein n=1 Tax=Clostridium TaxID=1485 RepID=UPI001899720B|nr:MULTISPECIES: PspC domain-containing protein [Clostridium]MCR1951350.1 PspC domain-containing protein [Clostridium sp. DSM 100503]MDI9218919.1 PspC domain-containing protein [Clostridium tertium]
MNKKLYKISSQKRVAGVCAGFAEYLNADVTLIRVLALLLILCSFSLGLIFYIGCALIMPDKSEIM